jgi:hypothetical protein
MSPCRPHAEDNEVVAMYWPGSAPSRLRRLVALLSTAVTVAFQSMRRSLSEMTYRKACFSRLFKGLLPPDWPVARQALYGVIAFLLVALFADQVPVHMERRNNVDAHVFSDVRAGVTNGFSAERPIARPSMSS